MFELLYSDVLFGSNNIGYYIEKASRYEINSEYKKAAEYYEKALGIDANIFELYKKIGDIFQYEIKDYNKAIDIYVKGLNLRSDDFGINLSLMNAYFKNNDIKKGIYRYEFLSSIRKQNQKLSFPVNVVDTLTRNMNDEMVINFCENYLQKNTTDTILRKRIADILIKKKEYYKAIIHLEILIKDGYIEGEIYFMLAVCNYHSGNYQNALNNFDKAKDLGEEVPDEYVKMVKDEIRKQKKCELCN